MATFIAELLRTTIFASSKFVKISSLIFLSLSLLFLAKLLSDSPFNPDPSAVTRPAPPPITVIPDPSPITAGRTAIVNMTAVTHPDPPPITVRPPPPPLTAERTGIVNSDGLMTDNFTVGPLDPSLLETEIDEEREREQPIVRVKVGKFGKCGESMREIIPCLDNAEAVSRLNSSERGEKYERHCPAREKGLNCLVPRPDGYKPKIPWPQSRDEVWYNNVPHTRLVDDKGGQNWISRKNDKFVFPGGGTQFIHGANQYLDQISKMVPDIAFGQHTRAVLDVGCGVASFGAFLLDRNVTTLSIAPKDIHENQIQFALERGVPAMVAVFGTRRLLYPSQAFDLIHCSRCRVNWTRDDGLLLLEANRMLRAGGYFVWAAQPVYKHEDNLKQQWIEMEDLTKRLCWELLKKEGYIAIWQKPLNNSCYANQKPVAKAPLCEISDDPDNVWYVDLKACITPLPDSGYGSNITAWPARLHDLPDRLLTIKMDAYMSRKEIFTAESKFWNEIVGGYISAFRWKGMNFRNVMDMRAGHGGFAAAMHDYGMDCWVMNVVPVDGFNTLPIIYDRGLIGVMHDWCEPFDTYPRTYDLLNAGGLFSVERKRCNASTIMLEMDRILRPDGRVSIRDSVTVIDELKDIAEAMGWVTFLFDAIEGPHGNWKVLLCEKRL